MRKSGRPFAKALAGSLFAVATLGGSAVLVSAPAWAYGPTPGDGTPQGTLANSSNAAPLSSGQVTPAVAASASTGSLAFTGFDVALATAVGAGAIAAGGGIVLVSRRRRGEAPSQSPI